MRYTGLLWPLLEYITDYCSNAEAKWSVGIYRWPYPPTTLTPSSSVLFLIFLLLFWLRTTPQLSEIIAPVSDRRPDRTRKNHKRPLAKLPLTRRAPDTAATLWPIHTTCCDATQNCFVASGNVNWPHAHTHTHTHTHGWAGTRKIKPTWILLKPEIVSGSGISWAVCKSASRSRQPCQHPTTQFLQAGCPSCHPTNCVKALKAKSTEYKEDWIAHKRREMRHKPSY